MRELEIRYHAENPDPVESESFVALLLERVTAEARKQMESYVPQELPV